MEIPGNSKFSKLFGSIAEKLDFTQLTLFRWKGSKRGRKCIGTIKNTTKFFEYSTFFFALLAKNIQKSGWPKILFHIVWSKVYESNEKSLTGIKHRFYQAWTCLLSIWPHFDHYWPLKSVICLTINISFT